jgi:hypothetical protein
MIVVETALFMVPALSNVHAARCWQLFREFGRVNAAC